MSIRESLFSLRMSAVPADLLSYLFAFVPNDNDGDGDGGARRGKTLQEARY